MSALAVVTPWFGPALHGGAERQAREIALRLSARGHGVEILTTCSRSFSDDWATNHHPPGTFREDNLVVRRFPADRRDPSAFDAANARLLAAGPEDLRPGVSPVPPEDARAFVDHNINSSALLETLRAGRERFRAFIFIPYLYGTTLRGLPLVADRALLQPCLHEEAYALLPAVAAVFRAARRVLFNSEGERELARRLYGPGIHTRSLVVGEGVETFATAGDAGSDVLPAELRGARFVLCLGRRDPAKNTDLLLRAFRQFKREHPSDDLTLVLAGPGAVESGGDTPAHGGVRDLGVVSEATKIALLNHALALFQPSRNESYSRALMESWLAARPAAAHRDCPATALAVERARGGWLAANEAEWAELFAAVSAAPPETLDELGRNGRDYAREHADWDKVIDRYEAALAELDREEINVGAGLVPARERPSAAHQDSQSLDADELARGGQGQALPLQTSMTAESPARVEGLRAVHQLLPDFVFGDAISNQALAIRAHLRAAGYESDIYAKRREARVAHEARPFDEGGIESGAGLIYHHSIGSEVTAAAVRHAGPKCLAYHNITPAEFFAPYRPGFAWLLETGRASLPRLARHFPCSVGDSSFNADELARCGFRAPGVLPIIVSPDKWNIEPDEPTARRLRDGRTNILFVGRVAPNKRPCRLVEIFAEYARLDAGARLIIAGEGRVSDPYFQHLLRLIRRLRLRGRVHITGQLTDAELLACYHAAHLFLSPSEHEGFGVPVVEAMWFDVPVLAARAAAVPETLGGAGVLFDPGEDLREVARLAKLLARDDRELRRGHIEAQRARREAFTPAAVQPALAELLRRMTTPDTELQTAAA